MLIEPLEPLTVRLPEGEQRLLPGRSYSLPVRQAEKLLTKVPGKIRVLKPNWVFAWRELAQLTEGFSKNDPRFLSVCEALEDCDLAFEQDNWTVFQQAAKSVKRLVEENELGG